MNSSEFVYRLPSRMDVAAAQSFLADVRSFSISHHTVTLDARDVEHITTPCLQIVLSLFNALRASGGAYRIRDASEAFCRAVSDLGLQAFIEVRGCDE